jgi:hypothetical protein
VQIVQAEGGCRQFNQVRKKVKETRHIPVLVLHRNEGAQSESLSMDYTVPLPTSKDFDFCIYMYLSPLSVRVNVYSTYIPTPNKKRKKIKQTLTQTKTQHKPKPEKQSGMCEESNEKMHDTLNRTVKPGVPETQQALTHTHNERACTHARSKHTYIHTQPARPTTPCIGGKSRCVPGSPPGRTVPRGKSQVS